MAKKLIDGFEKVISGKEYTSIFDSLGDAVLLHKFPDKFLLSNGINVVTEHINWEEYIKDNKEEWDKIKNLYHFKILALLNSEYRFTRTENAHYIDMMNLYIKIPNKTANILFEKGFILEAETSEPRTFDEDPKYRFYAKVNLQHLDRMKNKL